MTTYTCVLVTVIGAVPLQIHRFGCRDIEKKYHHGSHWDVVAESPEDAVGEVFREMIENGTPYEEGQIRIMDCARGGERT